MNEIFGIPSHPLIVHASVVLLPLALVGVILCLVRPSWRSALIYPTVVLGGIGAFTAILATQSGEWLQERVQESQLVSNHQQLGEMARNFAILFAGALLVWGVRELVVVNETIKSGFLKDFLSPKWMGTLITVGLVLFGTLTTVWIVQAGHSGAKAAWHGKVGAPRPGSGENGGG
ncbi:MAG: hypothetical protein NTY57_05990 [Solirubrobacterales bacterium]|nr:hypothetical protein [Solirubrobacterales bacterium]